MYLSGIRFVKITEDDRKYFSDREKQHSKLFERRKVLKKELSDILDRGLQQKEILKLIIEYKNKFEEFREKLDWLVYYSLGENSNCRKNSCSYDSSKGILAYEFDSYVLILGVDGSENRITSHQVKNKNGKSLFYCRNGTDKFWVMCERECQGNVKDWDIVEKDVTITQKTIKITSPSECFMPKSIGD